MHTQRVKLQSCKQDYFEIRKVVGRRRDTAGAPGIPAKLCLLTWAGVCFISMLNSAYKFLWTLYSYVSQFKTVLNRKKGRRKLSTHLSLRNEMWPTQVKGPWVSPLTASSSLSTKVIFRNLLKHSDSFHLLLLHMCVCIYITFTNVYHCFTCFNLYVILHCIYPTITFSLKLQIYVDSYDYNHLLL